MVLRDLLGVSVLTTSLIGFLSAAWQNFTFWRESERWQLIQDCDALLSEELLVTVETALSTVRHASTGTSDIRTWRQYQKQYAVLNRPLGAMLLREGFMRLVMVCGSALVTVVTSLREEEILTNIMTQYPTRQANYTETQLELVDVIATISAREIVRLEEGSDYLQLGSTWQQRLAYTVKASALTAFLCCALVNEEAADADVLMPWLEASLGDQSQAADVHLVSVVLRTMAILATISPETAATLGRTMPRIIVRTPLPSEGGNVAADCLLFVLKQLPQDTVITTLYSLGNALSARSAGEIPSSYALFNDISIESQHPIPNGSLSASSTTLMSPVGADEDPKVYNAVIQAVVRVAHGIGDETITALALSMLIQKVGKVSMPVDLKIISETAILAGRGAPGEFRAVLRLYMRLIQQGLAQNLLPLVEAVSIVQAMLLPLLTIPGLRGPRHPKS